MSLEVEYEITPGDLYAFQWRAAYQSPPLRRERRKVYFVVFLSWVSMSFLPTIGSDGIDLSRFDFMWLVTMFPPVAFLVWLYDRRKTRRSIRELIEKEKPGRGQLGSHKISLNEQGLVESTAVGESHISWAGVDRIEQNEEYIFIYTAPNAAHVIPKRAFHSAQETDSFYQMATARRLATTSNSLPLNHSI